MGEHVGEGSVVLKDKEKQTGIVARAAAGAWSRTGPGYLAGMEPGVGNGDVNSNDPLGLSAYVSRAGTILQVLGGVGLVSGLAFWFARATGLLGTWNTSSSMLGWDLTFLKNGRP